MIRDYECLMEGLVKDEGDDGFTQAASQSKSNCDLCVPINILCLINKNLRVKVCF